MIRIAIAVLCITAMVFTWSGITADDPMPQAERRKLQDIININKAEQC